MESRITHVLARGDRLRVVVLHDEPMVAPYSDCRALLAALSETANTAIADLHTEPHCMEEFLDIANEARRLLRKIS